jgi:fructose-bisphosphate aldolase class I
MSNELQATIEAMLRPGCGLLAADESAPTIAKRFAAVGVESTEASRRAYRSLLLATPGLGDFIGGVILYEETLAQHDAAGTPLAQVAAAQGIVPGIRRRRQIAFAHAPGDDHVGSTAWPSPRLYKAGARFASGAVNVSATLPGWLAMQANADSLARYAAICQSRASCRSSTRVLLDATTTSSAAPR